MIDSDIYVEFDADGWPALVDFADEWDRRADWYDEGEMYEQAERCERAAYQLRFAAELLTGEQKAYVPVPYLLVQFKNVDDHDPNPVDLDDYRQNLKP